MYVLCLPREDSFLVDPEGVAARHPNWRLVNCPVCGDGCYISPDHERMLLTFPGLRATCTRCALEGRSSGDR